jgi:transcriptional regulator with XRE-family HTH domain
MENSINAILKGMAGNIRAMRLMRNYSQDYLALKLKISQNAYSKIELGRTLLTVERLLKIACVLEIGILELLDIPQNWHPSL